MSLFETFCLLFMTPNCYEKIFTEYDFLNVLCLNLIVTKCLGYSIIFGSVLVKVPQIMKICSSRSAEGINLAGQTIELYGLTGTLCYSFSQNFPFSAYGESLFLAFQTLVISALVIYYSNRTGILAGYIAVYIGFLAFLLSNYAPYRLLWAIQAGVVINIILARTIQALENLRNGSTGQLSALTVFLVFGGAMARVFTSIQETGDPVIVLQFVVASLCNGVIAAQMFYYWNSDSIKPTRAREPKKTQ